MTEVSTDLGLVIVNDPLAISCYQLIHINSFWMLFKNMRLLSRKYSWEFTSQTNLEIIQNLKNLVFWTWKIWTLLNPNYFKVYVFHNRFSCIVVFWPYNIYLSYSYYRRKSALVKDLFGKIIYSKLPTLPLHVIFKLITEE